MESRPALSFPLGVRGRVVAVPAELELSTPGETEGWGGLRGLERGLRMARATHFPEHLPPTRYLPPERSAVN